MSNMFQFVLQENRQTCQHSPAALLAWLPCSVHYFSLFSTYIFTIYRKSASIEVNRNNSIIIKGDLDGKYTFSAGHEHLVA